MLVIGAIGVLNFLQGLSGVSRFLGMCTLNCLVVELLFLAGSCLAVFLGYWKFGCLNIIVQFSRCNLIFAQSSLWDITSLALVFRVDPIMVLTAFLGDFVFLLRIWKFYRVFAC